MGAGHPDLRDALGVSTGPPTPCTGRARRPGLPSPGHFAPQTSQDPRRVWAGLREAGRRSGHRHAEMTGSAGASARQVGGSSLGDLACQGRHLVLQTGAVLDAAAAGGPGVARGRGGGIGRRGTGRFSPPAACRPRPRPPVFGVGDPCPRASHTPHVLAPRSKGQAGLACPAQGCPRRRPPPWARKAGGGAARPAAAGSVRLSVVHLPTCPAARHPRLTPVTCPPRHPHLVWSSANRFCLYHPA